MAHDKRPESADGDQDCQGQKQADVICDEDEQRYLCGKKHQHAEEEHTAG